MKSVVYHPSIRQSPDLYALAEKATRRLDEIVGEHRADAEAEWDTAEDANKQKGLVTLTIREHPEEVRGSMAREDLERPDVLRARLGLLWDDLLADRLHRLLREFHNGDESGENSDGR
jgi:hypothetical protein